MRLSCDINHLDPALRVLLTSDGTVTDMLETICGETIKARRIAQEVRPAIRSVEPLELPTGESLLYRRVLLQGERTSTNYIYAESWIAIERLDVRFQEGLLASDTPIGRLWRSNRVEIFKELILISQVEASHIAHYFGTAADMKLLVRTCRVFILGRPVMLISEHFSPALAGSTSAESCSSPRYPEGGRTHSPYSRLI